MKNLAPQFSRPAVTRRSPRLSQTKRAAGRLRQAGYTIVEVQIAVLLMLIAMWGISGHQRAYNSVMGGLETENRVRGVVDVTSERAIVAVSEKGGASGPPQCEIRLVDIDTSGSNPVAEVIVRQRGL